MFAMYMFKMACQCFPLGVTGFFIIHSIIDHCVTTQLNQTWQFFLRFSNFVKNLRIFLCWRKLALDKMSNVRTSCRQRNLMAIFLIMIYDIYQTFLKYACHYKLENCGFYCKILRNISYLNISSLLFHHADSMGTGFYIKTAIENMQEKRSMLIFYGR